MRHKWIQGGQLGFCASLSKRYPTAWTWVAIKKEKGAHEGCVFKVKPLNLLMGNKEERSR